MMKVLSWIIMLPAAVVVIVFSVANRDAVSVDLWPFPLEVEAPFSLFLLSALAIGFAFGAFGAWVSGGAARTRARANGRRAAAAERDLDAVRGKMNRLKDLPQTQAMTPTQALAQTQALDPMSDQDPPAALLPPGAAPPGAPTSRDAA